MAMKLLSTLILLLSFSQVSLAEKLSNEELGFFINFFNKIQPMSFAENREFCGYIGLDQHGGFMATAPHRGEENSCTPQEPPEDFNYVGSYHTHGAFSVDADSELPSLEDMQADIEEDVDGFIATPGGRIWHIDTIDDIARMVCDRNCVLADPNFDESVLEPVERTYTLEQLKEFN